MNHIDDFIRQQRQYDKEADKPLSGIRVLDLSSVVAAPFAAALLGDAGADVIKIEAPTRPDPLRQWRKLDNGIEPYHAVIGRHKYPITLNLKSPEGRELFLALVKQADILIENLRVGAMDRLDLSAELLLSLNPGLIIGKVSGYGMTGSKAQQPGFGTLAEAFSGFTYLNGCNDRGPACPPNALADLTTGVHLAHAISLALLKQKRGERGGQVIDISLYEPLFGYLGGDYLLYQQSGTCPEPLRNELPAAAPRNIYRSLDQHWIALSCSSQSTWEALARTMDRPDLIQDPRFLRNQDRIELSHRAALNDIIGQWIAKRTKEELLCIFQENGITAGPVMTLDDIANDQQFMSRESLSKVRDPSTGIMLEMPSLPFRQSTTSHHIRFPGLPIGSANTVILSELLHLTAEQQKDLRQQAII